MSNESRRFLFYLLTIQIIIVVVIIQTALADNFLCEKDGFFPDKRDCWIYHICVGSTHSVKACKEDLLFNPLKNECDWAMNVNCNTASTESTPATTVSTYVRPPPDNIISIQNISTSDSVFDYLCQSIDNDYIAHPTDCKQYAYCANTIPQPKVCKKGLFWSQAEKMCVWPAQSDCPVKKLIPPPPPLIPVPNGQSPPWMNHYSTRGLVLPPTRPPGMAQSSIVCPPNQSLRLPDPYDCTVYHDCYHGTDLASHCPAQLQYNPETKTCDYAQNVKCTHNCTLHNHGARFIDPSSCCHYYECVVSRLVHRSCSHPDLFDIHTRKCLPYRKVKCDGRRPCLNRCHYFSNVDTAGKELCGLTPSCAGHSDGFYLDRTKPNCQSYMQCMDSRVVNISRCPQNQRFNRNMGRCTAADQVPCFATPSVSLSFLMFILPLTLYIVL